MDTSFELGGDSFVWDSAKAEKNLAEHSVSFEEAVADFSDPLFVLLDAYRNDKARNRNAAIGFDVTGRLLYVVHIEFDAACIRIISARRAGIEEEERYAYWSLEKKLVKDCPQTTVTIRFPVDVVDSMKEIAPRKGFSGYQTLLKSYVSEGLRRDEAMLSLGKEARLIEALKKRGVPESLIEEAERDAA